MTAGGVSERGIIHLCSLGCRWRVADDGTAIRLHGAKERDCQRCRGAVRGGGFAVTFARGRT
jgi:hypothetical protein